MRKERKERKNKEKEVKEQSLFGKMVKFWFVVWGDEKIKGTGIVTDHIIPEGCLTVRDNNDGISYYVGIDQVEVMK